VLAAVALQCTLTWAARAQSFAERVAPCLACHGGEGQSSLPNVPSLGAQPAPYALIQLYLFRGRQRRVEVMNEATKDFSDDDLKTFSDFIATLPAPKRRRAKPPSRGVSSAARSWCANIAAISVTTPISPVATTSRAWRGSARTI
jgi:cytochrome c553